MIELYENQLKNFERQSSKGNQLKWQNDNYWYKADYAGYEGLVEYVVSKLLSKSNLKPVEYVDYELEKIKYKRNTFYGVRSEGFLSDTALDYPMNDDVVDMIDEVKSKTICTDFDMQLDSVEKIFGYNIKFSFSKKGVDLLLEKQDMYSSEIVERVRTILYQRIRKFRYLFS